MYVRLCETINNVGKLVLSTDVAKFIENQEKDYYGSIFLYNEDQKRKAEELIEVTKDGKTFTRPKGVSGIKEVVTNRLVFDFDSANLQEARLDTLELIQRLEKNGVNSQDLNICFSGSKGFSVELSTTERFTPEEFKTIVHSLASDLKTFDPKIVDPNRVFRIPFTKHPKTGLYKTPLSKDELEGLSVDEIKELSSKPIKVDAEYLLYTTVLPDTIKKLRVPKKKETPIIQKDSVDDLDLSTKPSWLSNWKYALSRGFFKEGTRSYALTILAATCKHQNMSKTQTYYFLKSAADEQIQRFGGKKFDKTEIWNNIIEVVYGQNWQGGSWSEDNFPEDLKQCLIDLGIPKQDTTSTDELVENVTDGFGGFINYAKDIDKNTMRFGIPSLDKLLKIRKGHSIGLIAPPGVGKCHGKGTKVIMFDGTIKNVEDVVVGDQLMGDDSTPRNVLSLARGEETLYEIQQENGDNYVINESHILSLKGSSELDSKKHKYTHDRVIDIPLKEYLSKGVDFKKRMKGYKVPVEFSKKELEVDPYVLGAWLGDGTTSKPEFTLAKKDPEILERIMYWGDECNLKINVKNYSSDADSVNTITVTGTPNTFRTYLQDSKLMDGKYIPRNYLSSNREDRLQLLAGLLDTDGYLDIKGNFEISGKSEVLMNQVVFLSRSLGFRTTISKENKHYKSFTKDKWYEGYSEMYRVHIFGDNLNEIPTLVPRKQAKYQDRRTFQDITKIDIKKLDVGEYFGFTLDGNHRYLLGDFTVTHNTSFAVTLANNMSKEGSHVYFASYDMYKNNVYQKLIQRHTGLKEEDIYKVFIDGNISKINEFKDILESNYENVTFCFKNGQTIGQLKQSIKNSEQKLGKHVDLVIVDYIELILTEKSDPTAASAEAAQGLREIANEGRVVLVLLQPNKMSSKPNEPMTSYNSAKGSSAIAQSVTSMLTLHRPGLHSRLQNEDNFIGLDCVKNRNGGLFSLDFYWDGKTQTFSEIDEIGKVRVENVRRIVRELENNEEEEW